MNQRLRNLRQILSLPWNPMDQLHHLYRLNPLRPLNLRDQKNLVLRQHLWHPLNPRNRNFLVRLRNPLPR